MFRFKSFLGSVWVSLLLVGVLYSYAAATTLEIDESTGLLTGATDVLVNGSYYDVEFVEGTAEELFMDAAGEWAFNFASEGEAREASNALLAQVFQNTEEDDFDDDPTLTYGSAEDSLYDYLSILTTYGLQTGREGGYVLGISAIGARNSKVEEADEAFYATLPVAADTTDSDASVYAKWTPAVSSAPTPTPEPSSILLFVAGLIGFAGMNRKKINNA
ncbi:PEP-CTERM sorting domain-containing protein [uncultured Desulfobacter sp.]|uniref:PEP-CTERM sorting domain-containing protein n=1 Tax=uncultured Desulfobacter sp. TaxID=240139 RepID=UPI0029F581D7|nr:PEP-CTERM sorting domain-containing protein [uncultured Desulfobacter sp.]